MQEYLDNQFCWEVLTPYKGKLLIHIIIAAAVARSGFKGFGNKTA